MCIRDSLIPRPGAVVVVGSNPELQRIIDAVIDPVVKPEQIGLVFIDKFQVPVHPVGEEAHRCGVASVSHMVEFRPGGIIKICFLSLQRRLDFRFRIDEDKIFDSMIRDSKLEDVYKRQDPSLW